MRHSLESSSAAAALMLALSSSAVVGCSGGNATRTVGAEFPEIDTLVLTINRGDGFSTTKPYADEVYTFGVANLSVSHRWGQDPDSATSLDPATPEAMDQLVMVVQSVPYRVNESCLTLAVD